MSDRAGGFPTEIPAPDYDIVAFENKFPTFRQEPDTPVIADDEFYVVKPSKGICEVVVYSPHHDATLTTEPVEQIYKLILVWTKGLRSSEAHEFYRLRVYL